MPRNKKPKPVERYFFQRIEGGHLVIKFIENEDGSYERCSEYSIIGGKCNCTGFQYHGECRHTKMITDGISGTAVSLLEARAIAAQLIMEFGEVFREVRLAEEPYEKDSNGKVITLIIHLAKPIKESSVIPSGSGAWESCLKDSGLKVRMVVE